MTVLRVIGVDPGPVPGVAVLDLDEGKIGRRLGTSTVFQCNAEAAAALVNWLCTEVSGPVFVQVERFVVGRRSARVSTASASATTRDMVGELQQVVAAHHRGPISEQTGTFVQRSASQVKPWATDERLDRAGLLDHTKGMRHARDAARHALFAAVRDCGLPDPLSKAWSP